MKSYKKRIKIQDLYCVGHSLNKDLSVYGTYRINSAVSKGPHQDSIQVVKGEFCDYVGIDCILHAFLIARKYHF